MRRASTALIGLALVVGACSSGGDEPAGDATGPADTPTTEGSEPVVEVDPAYAGMLDALGGITLITPETGGGERPVLAWEPVEDAAQYVVVVLNPGGQPYWGWRTDDTEVRLGVGDRADGVPGPRVADGMTWSVVANDADGIPVAASARRPIGP